VDNLNPAFSDSINIIVLLAKYHIHCKKWRGSKPSFSCFVKEFKMYYSSLCKI